MDEKLEVRFSFYAAHGEPIYTLAECIAADHAGNGSAGDDSEDMTELTAEIKERFRRSVYLCDEQMLDFLRFAADLSDQKAAWEDNYENTSFYCFRCNDFVYLYENGDKYYLVLPDELMGIFREVLADENFAEINAKKLELKSFASALIEIYGAFEIRQFAEVWNHHHKDKINMAEAEAFLSDFEDFDSDFYIEEGFAVHDCLEPDEFDELFDETYAMEYYMPAKSVIREYANKIGDYDFKIPGEKEMDDFLAGYIENIQLLDMIQFEIVWSCERLQSAAEVRGILENADLPLDDAAFVEKFEKLYNNLRGNTHIWELRGFTPYQYQVQTGSAIPYFRLPEAQGRGANARKKGK